MKIYKTQKEIRKDIKDGVLEINGDVKFECSFSILASIKVAGNINARNINAWDINAEDINAENINALNIDAWDINAEDINAENINAGDINAGDILYYAFCCVYKSIKCFSIKAKRGKHQEPICLDGELIYEKKEVSDEIELDGKKYSKQTIKRALREYTN